MKIVEEVAAAKVSLKTKCNIDVFYKFWKIIRIANFNKYLLPET